MSNLNLRSITGKDGQPVSFPTGITIGTGAAGTVNNIGIPGQRGFGVGICPNALPAGMVEMTGCRDQSSDNYGHYQYSDGSVMIWWPVAYIKRGTGANGLAINQDSIVPFSTYPDVATANAAGYSVPRAFYDNGALQPGYFRDAFKCSNNGGIASSIKNGIPVTSAQRGILATAVFSACTGNAQAPANFYYGAIAAAKSRGNNFFPASIFMKTWAATVSKVHGQAATSSTFCAWYDPAGITNFPKGLNNNALGDVNDAAIAYISDGNGTYAGAGKTGSANFFARTTHNGQNCGSADENGLIYEICLGLTSDATNIYILNTAAAMKNITAGNALATDAWGATAYAAQYTSLGTTFGALWATGANRTTYYGSATQVFNAAVSGNAWAATGAGIPLATGIGGTNAFGQDYFLDYKPNEMCPIAAFGWSDGAGAGVWALHLYVVRGDTSNAVGFRSALYL
jgi:hypothetical protein